MTGVRDHDDPRQALLDALTLERFGGPVREYHQPASDTEAEAKALRLVIDNERKPRRKPTRGAA